MRTLCIELDLQGNRVEKSLQMIASISGRESTLRHTWMIRGGSLTPDELTDIKAAVDQTVHEWLLYVLGTQLPLWTEERIQTQTAVLDELFNRDSAEPTIQISRDSNQSERNPQ